MKTYENFNKTNFLYILLKGVDKSNLDKYTIFYGELVDHESYSGKFIKNQSVMNNYYITYLMEEIKENGDIYYEDDLVIDWKLIDSNFNLEPLLKQYNKLTATNKFKI